MREQKRLNGLHELATLTRTLNSTLAEISAVIGRPAQLGHAGEFIASVIFDIDLHVSASFKHHDGFFNVRSPLAGRSVNVKWVTVHEGYMDLSPDADLDELLVMTGPKASSKHLSKSRPWVIASVYLFDAREITSTLQAAGIGVGVASSVRKHLWDAAMIYPDANNPRLVVTDEQRTLLSLFAPLPVPTGGGS